MTPEFQEFRKIPRYSRPVIITEKIDGTNGVIHIAEGSDEDDPYVVTAGSRSRWITPDDDNFDFAAWVRDHTLDLLKLGPGYHYGEWWGKGINRGYGQDSKRFSLFNTSRWSDPLERPTCCDVVPVLYEGMMSESQIKYELHKLVEDGSFAAPGFKPAEGIVIYHVQGNLYFKKTIFHDEVPKGQVEKP